MLSLLPDVTNVTQPELEASQHHVQTDVHAETAAVESQADVATPTLIPCAPGLFDDPLSLSR